MKLIKNRIIIIPFTLPWDWSADFQKQTCLELSRRNLKVIAYMNDEAYFFLKKSKKKYPKIKNISFYIPKYYFPFRKVPLIESTNKYLSLIIFSITILLKNKIIWLFDPQFHYFSKFFINKTSLYDCVDFFGKEQKYNENKLIKNSNLFFVNSKTLKKLHKNKKKNIYLVPQGFNDKEFVKNTKIISRKEKKEKLNKNKTRIKIGYIGGINYRIDYQLCEELINNNPQWNFEFWGPIQNSIQDLAKNTLDEVDRLKEFNNVKFDQTSDKLKLIKIINDFDICIIPYDVKQDNNLYSYPMKVFEYFYLGKPVVSTPIQELLQPKFKNLIYTENSSKGFEEKIKNLLKLNWSNKKKVIQKKLSLSNSWGRKLNKITNKINNHNFHKVK